MDGSMPTTRTVHWGYDPSTGHPAVTGAGETPAPPGAQPGSAGVPALLVLALRIGTQQVLAHPLGGRDGLPAGTDVELAQHVLDVRADGLGREHQLVGDLVGALAGGEEVED